MPGTLLAFLILPATIVPLILQPDFGQTMLVTIVWCGLFFVAGLHWFWVMGLGGAGLCRHRGGLRVPAARARPHRALPRTRISGDTFQVDTAMESFSKGGWLGRGPGRGHGQAHPARRPYRLHLRRHGEEFGIVVCLAALVVFAFIVLRGLMLARQNEDTFCRLAITRPRLHVRPAGRINMMVNVHLMPAKGMTLPFISYGGSSLLSLAPRHGLPHRAHAPPARAPR